MRLKLLKINELISMLLYKMPYRKNMRKTLKKTKKYRGKYSYNKSRNTKRKYTKRNNRKNFTKRNFKYTKKLRGGADHSLVDPSRTKTKKVSWGKIRIIKDAIIDKSLLDKLPGYDNSIYSNGVIIYNDEISLYISMHDIVRMLKKSLASIHNIKFELNNSSSLLYNTNYRLMKQMIADEHRLDKRIINLDISKPVKNKLFKQLEKHFIHEYTLYVFGMTKLPDKVLINFAFMDELDRDECFDKIKQIMVDMASENSNLQGLVPESPAPMSHTHIQPTSQYSRHQQGPPPAPRRPPPAPQYPRQGSPPTSQYSRQGSPPTSQYSRNQPGSPPATPIQQGRPPAPRRPPIQRGSPPAPPTQEVPPQQPAVSHKTSTRELYQFADVYGVPSASVTALLSHYDPRGTQFVTIDHYGQMMQEIQKMSAPAERERERGRPGAPRAAMPSDVATGDSARHKTSTTELYQFAHEKGVSDDYVTGLLSQYDPLGTHLVTIDNYGQMMEQIHKTSSYQG